MCVQVKVTKIVMEAMDTSVQAYLDKGRLPNTTGKPPPLPFVSLQAEMQNKCFRMNGLFLRPAPIYAGFTAAALCRHGLRNEDTRVVC